MDKILTGDIWKQVKPYAKAAGRRLVAVAYVSSDGLIEFRQNDVLICDASNRAIKSGETSARLLQSLHERGVEIRSRPDLHAKAAVFGRYALVGSCNLSRSSAKELTELALLSDRKQIVSQTTAFIHYLRETSKEISDGFLRRILKIKVRPAQRRGPRKKRETASFGNKVWLVSVYEMDEDSVPKEEQPYVEKGENEALSLVADKDATITWIRFTGKTRCRMTARPGDIVIQIYKSLSGKRFVLPPSSIVYRQDISHWTRFYISESRDCRALSWKRFMKLAKQYGLSRISKDSCRELNPREAMAIEGIWK